MLGTTVELCVHVFKCTNEFASINGFHDINCLIEFLSINIYFRLLFQMLNKKNNFLYFNTGHFLQ